MSVPTRIRAQSQGGKTLVRMLLSHAMDNGQRKDETGNTVPAWFIQRLEVRWKGQTVLSAYWGTAVSKNPFVQFSFQGGQAGDTLTVSWVDNHGDRRTDDALIA